MTTTNNSNRNNSTVTALDVAGGVASATFKMVKFAVIAFGLFLLAGTYVYGHSTEFKARCVMYKLGDKEALSFPKTLVCDTFDIGVR